MQSGLFDDPPEDDVWCDVCQEHHAEPACTEPPEVTPEQLARRDDPDTSKEAAHEIMPSIARLHEWAADCVKRSPGLTQRELGRKYCADDLRRIGRRLAECERIGLVRRGDSRPCSISNKKADTWWPPLPKTEA